jgi:hypothetical protein
MDKSGMTVGARRSLPSSQLNGAGSVMRAVILGAALLLVASNAHAEGRIVFGAGNITCGEWLKFRQSDDKPSMFQAQAYVDGFLSGYNMATAEPDFLLPEPKAVAFYAWIDNYCSAKPLDVLVQAIFSLRKELSKRSADK